MILSEVLHAHIPVLTRESTVRDAIDKMDIYQFPALVVVDADSKPVAVVTEGDMCRAAAFRDNLTSMASDPAYLFGSAGPICAEPTWEISDAFHRMIGSGLTILPVVADDRLLGVVLRVDLMQALFMDSAVPDPSKDEK